MVIQLNLSLQTPPQYKHLIVDSSLVCKDTKLCTIPTPIIQTPPHFNSQEKLKTMLMQYFGVTNKEHYGMLWYFLEWSIVN